MSKLKIKDLVPDDANFNKGTEFGGGLIEKSLQKFGAGRSILIDKNNRIIAGNKTIENAASIGLENVRVIETTGDEIVAVKRTDIDLNTKRGREMALADNATAKANIEWDFETLGDWEMPVDEWGIVEPTFFGAEDETDNDAEPQLDKAEELNKVWQVKAGDLWQIGTHRLLCGDSAQVNIDRDVYRTLLFDPPWDKMTPVPAFSHILAFADGQRLRDVITLFGAPLWVFAWDCVTSWYTPNRPLKRMKLCAWYGNIEIYDFNGAHYGDAGEARTVVNTRGEYEFKPDVRGKHLSDVFVKPITAFHASSEHPHSKPSEWIQMLLANCTEGDVYDPFAGSGTTLIAAQNLNRKCYAIELSANYCAVILQRMKDAFPELEIKRISTKHG